MKGLKSIGLLCVLALCISGCKGQEKDMETVQADPQDQIKEEAGEAKQSGLQEQEVPEGMVQYDNGVFRLQYDPDKWMEPMAFEESDGVCAVYLFENRCV